METRNATSQPVDLESLRQKIFPVQPEDTMAEAGRKILLNNFVFVLEREAGSRIGEDIEETHHMRVAVRRMRSTFRLFKPYYKANRILPFRKLLKALGRVLGAVRDLEVMITDLTHYQTTLAEIDRVALQSVVDQLEVERQAARTKLIAFLDSLTYQEFVYTFSLFLTIPGEGAKLKKLDKGAPYQVRHILPVIIYSQLATVRAYDAATVNIGPKTFHPLRIDCKRLRYTVANFDAVLGKTGQQFIAEIKILQDDLGRLNDIAVARARLDSWLHEETLAEGQKIALRAYIDTLRAEESQRVADFPTIWAKFNTRKVRHSLSDALLVLR